MTPPPHQGTRSFAAVDLGATSGRVVVGRVGAGDLELTEVHRFANTPVRLGGGLHWDIRALYQNVLDGLGAAGREFEITSVGIDSWAVDYGLLDADGKLLADPYHYRDTRTSHEIIEGVWERISAAELYQINGLQHLPFNTVYQLAAARDAGQLDEASLLLLIPDLITYWLTGRTSTEATNASTTGFFDARTRTWSEEVLRAVEIDSSLLAPLCRPGDSAGMLLPAALERSGLHAGTEVVAVASHDTASAVAAVPATNERFAYISCGTWSLAGIELPKPVLTEDSKAANFTNELGVDGTVRFLRNIMGLWLLTESLRTWAAQGRPSLLPDLLDQAADAEPFACLIDPDDPTFLSPGDMPARIAEFCRRTGQQPPRNQGAVVRCILESLALAHRHALRQAATLADREIDVVHLVGGGSRNELLCQLTADATGLPVVAGPTEATALGNTLIQARARGMVGDLAEMRGLISRTQNVRRYHPRAERRAWDAAAARVGLS
ncbi:rhamnulokinase [Actinospica robiniae]|uniref:rhamnulokinase n=1 Tax=Actinospica robiniae TaxID=304901 RepID=UPI000550E07E|nr:rhamnulokinase family protein [Actinospica robiniae]